MTSDAGTVLQNGTGVGGGMLRYLLVHARSVAGLVFAVALVWLLFSLLTGGIFASERNLINLMRQTSVTAMIGLGMMVVIAQGEIDLSVGSVLGLCATVIGLVEATGVMSPAGTILIVLALGAMVGLWNGLLVACLGIPAFVATLGGMLAFRGIALALSEGRTLSDISDGFRFSGEGFLTGPALWGFLAAALVAALLPLRQLSDPSKQMGALLRAAAGVAALGLLAWASLSYRGLPMPVALTLVAAAILAWALSNTVWGRHCFAVGGNRAAAHTAGIAVSRHLIVSFVLIGTLTAFAAVLFVGRLGAAPPEAGTFLELNAIAAVVIGGASLYGGSGTVFGVLMGALLMQSLSNGLSLLNVPSAFQSIASGAVLILAVYVDVVSKRGGRLFLRQ